MRIVTFKSADNGANAVEAGDRSSAWGEPVRNVSDELVAQLKAIPGHDFHISAGTRASDTAPRKD